MVWVTQTDKQAECLQAFFLDKEAKCWLEFCGPDLFLTQPVGKMVRKQQSAGLKKKNVYGVLFKHQFIKSN